MIHRYQVSQNPIDSLSHVVMQIFEPIEYLFHTQQIDEKLYYVIYIQKIYLLLCEQFYVQIIYSFHCIYFDFMQYALRFIFLFWRILTEFLI